MFFCLPCSSSLFHSLCFRPKILQTHKVTGALGFSPHTLLYYSYQSRNLINGREGTLHVLCCECARVCARRLRVCREHLTKTGSLGDVHRRLKFLTLSSSSYTEQDSTCDTKCTCWILLAISFH